MSNLKIYEESEAESPLLLPLKNTFQIEMPECLTKLPGFNEVWNLWLYHCEEENRTRSAAQQSLDLMRLLRCDNPIQALEIAIEYNSKQIKQFYGEKPKSEKNRGTDRKSDWEQFDKVTGGFE